MVLIGWELPHGSPNWATHSPEVGVMGVKLKESTHGVDNLYKYLINKNIYVGLTKFPEISAICLVVTFPVA